MSLLIGKAHDLIFQGWTVTGTDPLDGTGIEGRQPDVFTDEPVGFHCCVAEIGRQSFIAEFFSFKGKWLRIGITVLTL